MEIEYKEEKKNYNFIFHLPPHDKFLALPLLTSLEKKS